MARSLRDELLKAGLVTGEQAARAERGSRPPSKPEGSRAAGNRAAKRAPKRRPRDAPKQRFQGQGPGSAAAPATPPAADPEARIRQLNLEIREILDTKAEKAEAETGEPFHFTRGSRIKRIYVSGDQRRRLSDGELAIVGFGGRHHLVPRPAGERIRELRSEVFVFIASGGPGADAAESAEGYEGYEVPDGLVW